MPESLVKMKHPEVMVSTGDNHMKLQKKDHLQVRTLLCIPGIRLEFMRGQQVRDLDITRKHKMTTQQLYNHGRNGSYDIFSGIAREVLVTFYTAQHNLHLKQVSPTLKNTLAK